MAHTGTHEAEHEITQDMAQVREDLTKLREDLKTVAEAIVHQGKRKAMMLQKQAGEGIESAKEYVADRPLTVAAVAFGAGILAGLLLSHRR